MRNKKLDVMVRYLGITETAELLGCSRMTLHNLLAHKYKLTNKMIANIERSFNKFLKVLTQEIEEAKKDGK